MDDRALGLLNPVEDDGTFATPYISQYLLWEQWCSVDQLGPYGSSQDETSTAAIVYTPTGPSPHDSFVYRSGISSTDLWSDNTPMTECTDPWGALIPITETSPSFLPSDPVTFEESPPFQDDDWHRPWIPTKQRRKRNRDTNSLPLRKSDRQSLSSDKDTTPLAKEKTQHTTIRPNRSARGDNTYAGQPRNDDMKNARERNRLAANKFRAKQRDDLLRLESSEQDLERIHRDLSTCVADLTLEIYNLKMELLQHSGCNCALIQNYLVHESQRYVQALEEGVQRGPTSWQPEQPGQTEQG
ncbi:hypothetical protein B0J15DRAFT_579497 [Fusarium solani]|uniref:BZIP domain-containing protein n=2 Tax=Fusarium solani TaxID=169388 RepID=A0A9P9FXS5_FUSSL|nr:uncharacterized protein B0J15DRAFT_579497 [Fusarium solani]KAH7224435.1 hypothetical protein B0J15DRAFT_579497 [Fusarium solani]